MINPIKTESYTARYAYMLVFVILAMGIVALGSYKATGNFSEITQEEIDQIIFHILRILEIALGYLVGRGIRLIFKT